MVVSDVRLFTTPRSSNHELGRPAAAGEAFRPTQLHARVLRDAHARVRLAIAHDGRRARRHDRFDVRQLPRKKPGSKAPVVPRSFGPTGRGRAIAEGTRLSSPRPSRLSSPAIRSCCWTSFRCRLGRLRLGRRGAPRRELRLNMSGRCARASRPPVMSEEDIASWVDAAPALWRDASGPAQQTHIAFVDGHVAAFGFCGRRARRRCSSPAAPCCLRVPGARVPPPRSSPRAGPRPPRRGSSALAVHAGADVAAHPRALRLRGRSAALEVLVDPTLGRRRQ